MACHSRKPLSKFAQQTHKHTTWQSKPCINCYFHLRDLYIWIYISIFIYDKTKTKPKKKTKQKKTCNKLNRICIWNCIIQRTSQQLWWRPTTLDCVELQSFKITWHNVLHILIKLFQTNLSHLVIYSSVFTLLIIG